MYKQDIKNLKKRYLLWLYKTTKETLDRIERKFTQLEIDRLVLEELKRAERKHNLSKSIQEFQIYIQNKEKEGLSLKYKDGRLKPDYQFLLLKLKAIEKAITKELGKHTLNKIKSLYEEEMMKRILEGPENR